MKLNLTTRHINKLRALYGIAPIDFNLSPNINISMNSWESWATKYHTHNNPPYKELRAWVAKARLLNMHIVDWDDDA